MHTSISNFFIYLFKDTEKNIENKLSQLEYKNTLRSIKQISTNDVNGVMIATNCLQSNTSETYVEIYNKIIDDHEKMNNKYSLQNSLQLKCIKQQYEVLDFVCKGLISKQIVQCVVAGGAGAGKSHLINAIRGFCALSINQIKVQVLAPSGTAAANVNGSTIHSFFHIGTNKSNKKPQISLDSKQWEIIEQTKLFIFDEYSMIDAELFLSIDRFLRDMHENENHVFGNVSFILFGDPAQLQPVQSSSICLLPMYKGLTKLVLRYSMRQINDTMFFSILENLRLGPSKLTLQNIERLKECCVNWPFSVHNIVKHLRSLLDEKHKDCYAQQSVSELLSSVTILVALNEMRNSFNRQFLSFLSDKKIYEIHALDIDLSTNRRIRTFTNTNVTYKNRTLARHQYPASILIKLNAKCMLLRNINVSKGWTNGCLCMIRNIKLAECETSNENEKNGDEFYSIENINTDDDMRFIGEYVHSITIEKLKPPYDTITIERHTSNSECNKYSRTQFPLDLAYSMTIHKAQGQTLERVYVCMDHMEQPGQLYVALSRVCSIDRLHLINFDLNRLDSSLHDSIRANLEYLNENDHLSKNLISKNDKKSNNTIENSINDKQIFRPLRTSTPNKYLKEYFY